MKRNIFAVALFIIVTTHSGAAASPQNVTYEQLLALKTTAKLVSDQVYRIIDFRTRHVIPYTQEINTGVPEVLLVRAVSATDIASLAVSEKYPQDILYYELADSSKQGGDRGRIIRRIDPVRNISSHEDWRNVKYRRWNTRNDGQGTYIAFTDNGNPSADYYPICNSATPDAECTNIDIGRPLPGTPGDLTNIVIMQGSKDIVLGSYVVNVTIGRGANEIQMAGTTTDVTIGDGAHHIRIGLCSDFIHIGNGANYITIGSGSPYVKITDEAYNIHIGDQAASGDGGFTIGNATIAPTDIVIASNVRGTGTPVITESNIILLPRTLYVGNGSTDSRPVKGTIKGTGGSGSDTDGADLAIAGGAGTGKGRGGTISIATAPPGLTGTSQNPNISWLMLDDHGHLGTAATGEEPSLSDCGKSPSIAKGSTDTAGAFRIGTSGTGCKMTFRRAFHNMPVCIVSAETSANLVSYTKSSSALVIKGLPGTYNYICYGLHEKE